MVRLTKIPRTEKHNNHNAFLQKAAILTTFTSEGVRISIKFLCIRAKHIKFAIKMYIGLRNPY